MSDVVGALAQRALAAVSSLPPGKRRYLVGVAGCPGAGKSTTVRAVAARINALAGADVAAVLPMDGFHYYRRELDAMPDPAHAHARRGASRRVSAQCSTPSTTQTCLSSAPVGAPFTFDAAAFVAAVTRVRTSYDTAVRLPSFDHAAGDPVPDDITITPRHRLVFVEGNYLFLPQAPWSALPALFDERWLIDVDPDKATQRIVRRHMAVWGSSLAEATARAQSNDAVNARDVWASAGGVRVDVRVPSYDEEAYAPAGGE